MTKILAVIIDKQKDQEQQPDYSNIAPKAA